MCREINFKSQIPDLGLTLKKILVKEKSFKEVLEIYELAARGHGQFFFLNELLVAVCDLRMIAKQ